MTSVLKIGGSILSSHGDFEKIVLMLKSRKNERIVIVVSALKGVTDLLIDSLKNAELRNDYSIKFNEVRQKHYDALSQLKPEFKERAKKNLDGKLAEIESLLEKAKESKSASPKTRDLVETFGERLSAMLVAEMLSSNGLKAKAFESQDIGMLTDGNYGKARPLRDEIKKTLPARINAGDGVIPVITGFYGADIKGNITSFGRGGSDYSAALIAEALGAESLELWKDVDGFLSADPKLAKNAVLVKALSYDEAEELGVFGAKIIHPKTVNPLRSNNAVLKIKNISKPHAEGTIVGPESANANSILSIAFKKEICLITVRSPELLESGTAAKLFNAVSNAGINIDLISTSETGISISAKRQDCRKAVSALKSSLDEEEVIFEEKVSLISVIGKGMREKPKIAGKIFSILGDNEVNIKAISQNAFENNISFVVEEKDLEKSVLCLHSEFFEKGEFN
ncbi:MAG: aspartate kinase [Candidatus Diapherotrites archaeon]|nr:aspartate kinase [Candidatus Diapherotrites archaeon]